MKSSLLRPLLVLTLALATSAFGQVTISSFSTTYSQTFDSLSTAGSWSNNSTIAGWYAQTTANATIATFGLNTGSTTTAGLYSYGVAGTNASTDRALGFMASNAFTGSGGSGYFGLRLTNAAGVTATSFTLAYSGEEWRRENNAASQSLTVQYAFGATSVVDSNVTWTTISALTFTSPIVGATTGAALDGNATANRATFTTGVTAAWTSGSELWIRWVDPNDSGNDHVLAIDNVSFSAAGAAVPEPSTYAALAGALALAGVIVHRRRAARG